MRKFFLLRITRYALFFMTVPTLCWEVPCRKDQYKDHRASALGFGSVPIAVLCYPTSFVSRYSVLLRMSPFDASNDQTVFIRKIGQFFCICQYLEDSEQILKCRLKTRFAQTR